MLLSENILHLRQTKIFVNVNITILIKHALTRSTETFIQTRRSSKANKCNPYLNFDPIDITLVQICEQYGVEFGGIKSDSMF